jgi:hypothetical protein
MPPAFTGSPTIAMASPSLIEGGKHLGLETMGDHEPISRGTVRVAGEQF